MRTFVSVVTHPVIHCYGKIRLTDIQSNHGNNCNVSYYHGGYTTTIYNCYYLRLRLHFTCTFVSAPSLVKLKKKNSLLRISSRARGAVVSDACWMSSVM